MKVRPWSREVVYFDSKSYFSDLFSFIDSARSSIEIETYIFELDEVGNELFHRLQKATDRGVRVRVILDGVGTWFTQGKIGQSLKKARVEVKIFHPFKIFGIALSQFNKRLHRKVVILDRKIVFTGSFNITAQPNRDTGVRLEGGGVLDFSNAFDRLWGRRFRRGEESRGVPIQVRLNESKRLRRLCNHDLSRRIHSAESRVWITNAYFVPPFFLLRDLCEAGLRGRDVRLILPGKPDHRYMKWLSQAFYRTLLLSGVRIFEYQKIFLHAKTWIIDEWVMVGSTNLNHRSLIHDLEVDVVLNSVDSKSALEKQFAKDLEDSTELSEATFEVGIGARVLHWVLLRFRFYA
jgi:cardiolipin synthase